MKVKYDQVAAWLLLIASVGYFLLYVAKYVADVPFFDDFRNITILHEIQKNPSELLPQLFQNFNGHRLAVPFGITWLGYLVQGTYHPQTMMLIGALSYVGLLLVMVRTLRVAGVSLLATVPLAFFLLQPSVHQNIFFALSTLQYVFSSFLTALMFLCLCVGGKPNFALALLAGLLLPYTNGNGMYVFLIGLPILLFMRRRREATAWAVALVANALVLYKLLPQVAAGSTSTVPHTNFYTDYGLAVYRFFSFLGSYAYPFRLNSNDTIGAGVLLFVLIGGGSLWLLGKMLLEYQRAWVKKGFSTEWRGQIALIATGGAILITSVGVALSRGQGTRYNIVDRYMLYSIWGLAVAYGIAWVLLNKKAQLRGLFVALPLSVFFSVFMYWYFTPHVSWWKNSLEADAYNLQNNYTVQGKIHPFNQQGWEEYKAAYDDGIYKYPPTLFGAVENQLNNPASAPTNYRFAIGAEKLEVYGGIDILTISLDAQGQPLAKYPNELFVLLSDTTNHRTYLVAPEWERNFGYRAFLRGENAYSEVFTARIYQGNLPSSTYRIGLLRMDKNTPVLEYSDQLVSISASNKHHLSGTFLARDAARKRADNALQ
ncbi:hypothetical protein GCM10027275_01190 [Rhabdobacter roseus]|uniref:Glycosyltransferase RgtA/B/C/D-like domain-containing protein n=1 Tax=Rhabdobacter roseus TaxID=1655419 RepID=A0A840TLA8_9BACT|nr:hypothetical protein [Rhabdobacter roseus]MBB5282003.1 hypothetical protein [Rhabdobacter roseus]